MGRFFQQDKPEFIDDNMFNLPYQLMGQVLMNKEKAVDDTIADAVKFYDKLSADVLQQDNPRAREVIQGYERDIESIVDNIKNNPMEYNKYSGNIRDLGRKINKDWTMGEIATLQKNKKDLLAYYADLDEKSKKDPDKYTADYIQAMKKNALKDYAEGAMYDNQIQKAKNALALDESTALPNLFEEFSKSADKMTADGYKIEQAYPGGPYIYKKGDKVEELTPAKLTEAFSSWVRGRTDYVGAVEQRKNLGLSDFQGADINSIYGYDKDKNLIFSDNYYGRNAKAIANTFKYKKTEHEEDLKSNEWYIKNAEWARADAKEKAEKELEHVDLTPTHVYTLGTENTEALSSSLQTANIALAGSQKALSDNAVSLGLKPGTERYKAFMTGDVATMVDAGMPEETAKQMSSQYKAHRTKKNFLNSQVDGFRDYMKSQGKDTSGIGKLGWTKNKDYATEYNNYLKSMNQYNDGKNIVQNLSSWNNIGIPEKTIKQAQEVFTQNYDQVTFNIDQTYKGQHLQFEDDKGNIVEYIPQDSKIKSGSTAKTKSGKTIMYLKAPGGKMSMQDLIRRGLVRTEMKEVSEDPETGEKKYQQVFTTRQNGKNVGVILNEKTLRVVNALDDKGDSNYSFTMQIGNNRIDALMNTKDMPIPSVDNYINENYDDLQFNRFMNQSNLGALGRRDTKGPNGSTLRTEKGKAYIIYADGRKVEVTSPAEKREIYKINYFESN